MQHSKLYIIPIILKLYIAKKFVMLIVNNFKCFELRYEHCNNMDQFFETLRY